jgi:hypothetical protein
MTHGWAAICCEVLLALACPPPTHAAPDQRCFAETNQCIAGGFLAYWEAHGGLAINGYPLTPERREVLEDGNTYTVQYFERVRLEYHPENPAPYDVLLGQFGRRIFLERGGQLRAVESLPGHVYFPETGHNLGGRFLDYWQANGGLTQFGYPISEITTDWFTGGPSNHYEVQYFERARFEYHPEHEGTPYVILLGQFGRDILAQVALLAANPDFQRFYTTDEALRSRLGRPVAPGLRFRAVTQAFEHGQMLYFDHEFYPGEGKRIYALCGDEQRGRLVGDVYGRTAYFIDTWDENQPVGGGPGPQPGLYEPRRGFGKVWRQGSTVAPDYYPASPHVRDCLGYALTANESADTLRVQQFERGLMLSSPDERYFYAIPIATAKCCGSQGTYERYPASTR